MINTLHIKNIGIIDDLSIDLNEGLNVLTGETGAGKTLIIDSLCMLAGGRFSKEMIRRGEDNSLLELCLYLPNHPQSIDGNIIISREVYTNGRNLCKINGRMATVNELKNFMCNMMDIHAQNENQSLLETGTHITLLDAFADNEVTQKKEEYQTWYESLQQIKISLKENYGDEKEKQRRLDLLKYQLNEIEAAHLKEGEEEELEEKRNKILHAEKIVENLNIADKQLSEFAIDAISTAIKAMEKIENLDESYQANVGNLKSIYYELQEASRDISGLTEYVEFDGEEQSKIEERLDIITSLKRKYGNNVQEILNYQREIMEEIEKIENAEEYTNELKCKQKQVEENMCSLATSIHETRMKYAKKLEDKINAELADLEMKQAKLFINIEEEKEFNKNGIDRVEFLICTNAGEEAKPLTKIASGGEMSRIMLAIKTVLADVDEVPILVFDEIDTGISGLAAASVGKKLKLIAKKHQVICVTHLPSIAAMGDYHYFISKEVIDQKTRTKVTRLSEEEAVQEIARIASGVVTGIAIKHATELRNKMRQAVSSLS